MEISMCAMRGDLVQCVYSLALARQAGSRRWYTGEPCAKGRLPINRWSQAITWPLSLVVALQRQRSLPCRLSSPLPARRLHARWQAPTRYSCYSRKPSEATQGNSRFGCDERLLSRLLRTSRERPFQGRHLWCPSSLWPTTHHAAAIQNLPEHNGAR
jgi:hypothetical protein